MNNKAWAKAWMGRMRLFCALGLVALGLLGASACQTEGEAPVSGQLSWVMGLHQRAPVGEFLSEPLEVRLVGEDGQPISGERISLAVVSGGGATDVTEAVSDEQGLARVRWRIGSGPEQVLKASVEGAEAVYVFANSNLPGEMNWTRDIAFNLLGAAPSHDNRILETPHFLTFSDGSSDEVKVVFAKMAEESLAELLEAFGIQRAQDIGVDPANRETKIKIYSIKGTNIEQNAHILGFLLLGQEASHYPRPRSDEFWFRREVKHEVVHMLHYLFEHNRQGQYVQFLTEIWFAEGLAEALSGGAFDTLTTLEQWQNWQQGSRHTNPVSIHSDRDIPSPPGLHAEFYPAYGLAVRYLLDPNGAGRTALDVKALYDDLWTSRDFSASFAKTFGMTVAEYEARFPDLIHDFLQRR